MFGQFRRRRGPGLLASCEETRAVAVNAPERSDGTRLTPERAESDSPLLETGIGAGLAEDVHRPGNHQSDNQERRD
jgi:hypothetical protein